MDEVTPYLEDKLIDSSRNVPEAFSVPKDDDAIPHPVVTPNTAIVDPQPTHEVNASEADCMQLDDAPRAAATSSTTPAAVPNTGLIPSFIAATTPTQPQQQEVADAVQLPPYPYNVVCELLMARVKQPVTGDKRTKHEYQKMRSNPKDLNPRCRDISTELTKLFGMEFPNTIEAWNELTRLSNGELVLDPPVPANPFFPEASFFCPKQDVACEKTMPGGNTEYSQIECNMVMSCLIDASTSHCRPIQIGALTMSYAQKFPCTASILNHRGNIKHLLFMLERAGRVLINTDKDDVLLTVCGRAFALQNIDSETLKCLDTLLNPEKLPSHMLQKILKLRNV